MALLVSPLLHEAQAQALQLSFDASHANSQAVAKH
jgi:hypothetical protein